MGKGQQSVKKEMQLKKILGVGKRKEKKTELRKIPKVLKFGTRYFKTHKQKPQHTSVFSFPNCILQSHETIDTFWSGFTRKLGLRHHTMSKDNWANVIPTAGSHYPYASERQSFDDSARATTGGEWREKILHQHHCKGKCGAPSHLSPGVWDHPWQRLFQY